jgi:hypothetical protein
MVSEFAAGLAHALGQGAGLEVAAVGAVVQRDVEPRLAVFFDQAL